MEQVRPWCFGYTRREGAQVPVEKALGLSPCLLLSLSFSPHALLRTHTGSLLAIKESRGRLMRGLKPFSFPSPCKPTPVHPSCVHSPGFDWNLSFTWWKELYLDGKSGSAQMKSASCRGKSPAISAHNHELINPASLHS